MAGSPIVYKLLVDSEDIAADHALLDGLGAGEAEYAPLIVEALLARARPEAMASLLGLFHQLDERLQSRLIDGSAELFSSMRGCIRADQIQTRLNTIELIRRGRNFRASYLLSLALRDIASRVRQEAAAALGDMVAAALEASEQLSARLAGDPARSVESARDYARQLTVLAEERRYLVASVLEAVEAYDVHNRAEVAEVAAWLAADMPESYWSLLSQKSGKLAYATFERLATGTDPRMVPFVYRALTRAELRPKAASAIANSRSEAFMRRLIQDAWLVQDVRIRRGLAWVKELKWLAEGSAPLLELPATDFVRAVQFVEVCGLTSARKADLYGDLLLLGPRPAQRAALWALVSMRAERSDRLLRTVLGWDDPELSPAARHELAARRPDTMPVTALEQEAALLGSSWAPDTENPVSQRPEHAEHGVGQVPPHGANEGPSAPTTGVLARLRVILSAARPSGRLRGLRLVNSLGLARELQDEVVRLAVDADPFVRSLAVSTLSGVGGPTAERILRHALQDDDPRVQANAIEALDQLAAAGDAPELRHKLDHSDNRVRANAVRALLKLRLPEAARALLDMLNHPNRMHRISALWLIRNLHLMTLALRVGHLARKDPDPNVRRAAAEAAKALDPATRRQDAVAAGVPGGSP
ncbi:MAG TPA: HEAT repeat domain-containing protein [Phycisphaerae bacterium]|nr:HEAT repeat domain-containing protein [Phycisphaerae bacterium]